MVFLTVLQNSQENTCARVSVLRCPEVFCKKGVLRNFVEFTGKHLCQSLFCKLLHSSITIECFKSSDSSADVFLRM